MHVHAHIQTGSARSSHLHTRRGRETAFQTTAAHVSQSASGGARFCEQNAVLTLLHHAHALARWVRTPRTRAHTRTHDHMIHERADSDTHTCSHSAPMCSTRTRSAALNCAAVCASLTNLTHASRSKDSTETDHRRRRTMKARAQDRPGKDEEGEQLHTAGKKVSGRGRSVL